MKTERHRPAYVLLVVIAVSVLMITLLSAVANLSLRRGLEAADAERSLQRRWGTITLERTLLNEAPNLFELREELAAKMTPGKPPEPSIRAAITLGEVTFDVLVGDEDAKLNLNAFYHHSDEFKTNQAVGKMIGIGATRALRLRPAVQPMAGRRATRRAGTSDEESESEPAEAFRSWGEVFDLPSLVATSGSDAALPNVTTGITCWGSGQLNFRRASDQAILAVAGSVVQDGGARRLLTRYRRSPTSTLAILLQTEVSNQRDRDALSRLMSETSLNFSIWIDASSVGDGSLRRFTVQTRDDEGMIRNRSFMQ